MLWARRLSRTAAKGKLPDARPHGLERFTRELRTSGWLWRSPGRHGSETPPGLRGLSPSHPDGVSASRVSACERGVGFLGLLGLVVGGETVAGERGVGPGGEVAEAAAAVEVVPELGRDDAGEPQV